MKSFICLLGIIFSVSQISIFSTRINGKFVVINTNNIKYTVLLQINTNTGIDDLGGTTIVFGFDTSAISFPSNAIRDVDYIFHNFNGGNYSSASITKPTNDKIWVNINLPFANSNNGTIVAQSPTWTDVVTLNFDIVNHNITPNLYWYLTSMFWGIYDADNITLWETGTFEGNFGLAVEVKDGWNMVSAPGTIPDGMGVGTWWEHKTGTVWGFNGSQYVAKDVATTGEGYWMSNNGNNLYNTGDEWPASGIQKVPNTPVNVSAGWNLIGGYEKIVQTNQITSTPVGLIAGPFYTYSDQYQIVTALEPGRGYIVKLNGQGTINFPNGLTKENGNQVDYFKDEWGKIIFSDNSNRIFTLYLVNCDIDLSLYELPPTPPEKLFDIRFGSGRIVEKIGNEIKFILMSGVDYPVKVMVENINIRLQDESGKIIDTELYSDEEITISNEAITKLKVVSDEFTHPIDLVMMQNYPNPFNPSTKISFTIPVDANVDLSIYNALGELVSNMVSEHLLAGYHEYQFNASKLASGVYFYRIKAGDLVLTKKMVLIR